MDDNSFSASESQPNGFDMLAAAIRYDSADIRAYGSVLVKTITDLFPGSMLEVESNQSFKDKLKGLPGVVKSVKIRFDDSILSLDIENSGPRPYVIKEVGKVVISKKEVPMAEWMDNLRSALDIAAKRNAENADALRRLIDGNP
jgi:hypothetical protein